MLTVTADIEYYSAVMLASSGDWKIEWCRSFGRAVEICRNKAVDIVIYDLNLPRMRWPLAVHLLASVQQRSRVLLASADVDEDLWQSVIAHGGYDIISRKATPDELRRVLQFAWQSLLPPAPSAFRVSFSDSPEHADQ